MELPVDPNQVGRVCLVTGGNGYVGKHLVRRLWSSAVRCGRSIWRRFRVTIG